jgi:hypothetical protein
VNLVGVEAFVGGFDGAAIVEYESEVGACLFVVGAEEGEAVVACFEVGPVGVLPHEFHAHVLIEFGGLFEVLDADGDVTDSFELHHGEWGMGAFYLSILELCEGWDSGNRVLARS